MCRCSQKKKKRKKGFKRNLAEITTLMSRSILCTPRVLLVKHFYQKQHNSGIEVVNIHENLTRLVLVYSKN